VNALQACQGGLSRQDGRDLADLFMTLAESKSWFGDVRLAGTGIGRCAPGFHGGKGGKSGVQSRRPAMARGSWSFLRAHPLRALAIDEQALFGGGGRGLARGFVEIAETRERGVRFSRIRCAGLLLAMKRPERD